ncbi:MAG: outer membrane beta-barrel protein [Spirochaetes bacterium]|nr:outer membrane beta-barrel protein [Spirochaetota bacterium]
MFSIKNLSKIIVILMFFIFVPASSYAIVDFSIYGGYSFAGELEDDSETSDMNGWQYGFYGHVNSGIPMLFTVGLGVFYQISPLTVDSSAGEVDATKTSYGLDGYAQVDLPFLPVFPYIRLGIAAKEEVEVESTTFSENFKSYYYGIGVSYTLVDVVVWDLQLFAEYLRTASKQEEDIEVKGNAVNMGLKIAL